MQPTPSPKVSLPVLASKVAGELISQARVWIPIVVVCVGGYRQWNSTQDRIASIEKLGVTLTEGQRQTQVVLDMLLHSRRALAATEKQRKQFCLDGTIKDPYKCTNLLTAEQIADLER